MSMHTVKRLAAEMMGVGVRRVKVNPARIKETDKVMTRADVKNLIKSGVVTKAPIKGRRKKVHVKRKGHGSRKGAWNARVKEKEAWMAKVRSQRALLRQIIEEGELAPDQKRKLYGRIKSGLFRSKRAMLTYLKDAGLLKPDYEPGKRPAKPEPETGTREHETGKPETVKQAKEVEKS